MKRELLEELPVAVVVTDPVGDVVEMNGAATELLGLPREQCLGKKLASFIDREALSGRARLRRQDGACRVIETKRRALADGCTANVLHDVTATAWEAQALRESQQQLKFIANAVPALLAFVDNDARYVWGNESYRRWFGLAPETIRGRHAREIVGEAAWEQVRPYVERALAGEEVLFDYCADFEFGTPREVHVAYLPQRNASGHVDGFVVVVNDLSQIKVAEQALRRSENMLAESQIAAHVGSWEAVLDSEGNRTALRWSDETYRMFGVDPAVELEYKHFREAVHPDDVDRAASTTSAGIAHGGRFENEYRVVRPDGTIRVIHAWNRVEADADGRPARVFGTIQDVTERRLAEKEIQRALQELKAADRQKDEFLAMLSHELRNPLAPILSAVEILRFADPGDPDLAAKSRAVIERQVNLMKRLLDDLMDVSRVRQGKIALRQELSDLGGLLQHAVEISRPMIAEKQQRLSVTSPSGTILVDADATRLVQVFANLLNNAAKYSDRRGHIELKVTVTGDEAIVQVRDDGVGMPPELLDRVFDLFVQEPRSLDRAQGGLGIGLTMVRSLVRMHGGSVRAFSEGPGCGCEVVVRLPLARADVPTARKRASSGPLFPGRADPLRILVVDDNVDAARMLGELLALMGHQVTLAPDGPTALSLLAAAAPELVLIDIGLPGMTGYTLAAALREAGLINAALVAVTGYGREEDLRRSKAAGFDHHLVKPIDLATLRRITTRQVDRD